MNPLIPSALDGFVMAAGVLSVVLAIWAIAELLREKEVWTRVLLRLVVIIFVPFLGALVSLYFSRQARRTQS